MEIRLIRHFATEGNLEKRYIGVTDEEIKAECVLEHTLKKEENGREEWKPELVIVSPLRRCRQTAEILFPGAEQVVCEQMRECDFGLFEGKNYQELTGNPKYQSWIDSGGTKAFPGGEDPMEFRKRCVCGFEEMMEKMIHAIKELIFPQSPQTVCFPAAIFLLQFENENLFRFSPASDKILSFPDQMLPSPT